MPNFRSGDGICIDGVRISSVYTLQHELYEDMARHVEREEESVPEIVDAYMYYTRTGHGESLPIYYRQPVDPSGMVDSRSTGLTSSSTSLNLGGIPHPAGHPVGPEQVVLDQNDLLKRHPYVCVGTVKLSEDHALMAYTIDTTGDETYSAGEE
jgi:oligopeptidase B